jgi:uncharacterized protein (TIGR02145 family)
VKPIIYFPKRNYWLKASIALIICVLFLASPSCQKDELNRGSIPDFVRLSASALSRKFTIINERVRDVEGNVYKTVKIGNQWWMAENLKTTRYKDGNYIDYPGANNTLWESNSNGAYAWYNNDTNFKFTYGALYNWYAVNTGKLCPTGWHVSSDDDWKTLEAYLGITGDLDHNGERGGLEGGKLKEAGFIHWFSPNADATNESGFTALAGSFRYQSGYYYPHSQQDQNGFFWTSTIVDAYSAWHRALHHNSSTINRIPDSFNQGYSVRCIKD